MLSKPAARTATSRWSVKSLRRGGLFLPEWPRADFEKTRRVCADLIFIADAAFAVAPEFNQ
jgi:hypothetical protein